MGAKQHVATLGSLILLALALLLGLPPAAQAQSTGARDQAARELERLQQEQRQRSEQEREEQRARQPRIELEAPAAPAVTTGGAAGPCRDIRTINLHQAASMGANEREKIVNSFAGRCLAVSDVEMLLGRITAYYFELGMIAARAYIQTQDLADGILNVLVLEGQVEALQLEDGERGSVNLATAFPGVVDRPLNLRDFEQGLDQINRLASNQAVLELQPGSEPGASIVVIRNQPSRRAHANLTSDNFGSESTGRSQVGVNLLLDNLAGVNDGMMLTYRSTVEGDYGEQHARTASFLYSVPFGRYLLTASHVQSDYATPIELSEFTLIADGESMISSLQLDVLAYRDRINRLSLSSNLSLKDSENRLDGERLDVSSQKLSSLALNVAWSTQRWGGGLSARLGLVHGLELLGAVRDTEAPGADPRRAQYLKWVGGLNLNRPLLWLGQPLSFSSSLSAQWSDDVLYGVEHLLVGSVFSVRGFRSSSLSGDRGYYWRNDLSRMLRLPLRSQTLSLRPYIGLDAGRIMDQGAQAGGWLAGAALGATLMLSDFSLDLVAARAIEAPSALPAEGLLLFANLGYRL